MKRLLDLFCCAGGAGNGYSLAGFEVVGVDISPQPYYPFEFVLADAIEYVREHGHEFDAIHASPPCQLFSRARLVGTKKNAEREPLNLIPQTREALIATGKPYIIENVPRAPLFSPIVLCGSSFGLKVRRHRLFESNVAFTPLPCQHKVQGKPVGVYHKMNDQVQGRSNTTGEWVLGGHTAETLEDGQAAMGIDWMPWRELTQAIPPAYTKFLGERLMATFDDARPRTDR